MRITKLLPFLLFLVFIVFSCKKESKNDVVDNDTTKENQITSSLNLKADFFLDLPENAKCGDNIKIALNSDDKFEPDSIVFFVNQKKHSIIEKFNTTIDLETKDFRVGKIDLTIKVFKGDKNKVFSKNIKLLSDIKPKQKTYKIINTFPHDLNAYTQGLCIDDGVLYEATGLETKSSLRNVNLKTGEVKYSITLKNNYFGEGITVFKDKIYQVTWRDHKGFVYEKEEFRVVAEFNYSSEGWGLTNDDEKLYMSDGTNKIHILDPNSLSFIGEIEVFDNHGPVYYLNELEYINGLIFANVYMQDFIVTIDPKTGKVISKIDFSNILPTILKTRNTDVFNGIAYDKKTKQIFVTGKNWPRMYEVKILDK